MRVNGKKLESGPETRIPAMERVATDTAVDMIRRVSLVTHMPFGEIYFGGSFCGSIGENEMVATTQT